MTSYFNRCNTDTGIALFLNIAIFQNYKNYHGLLFSTHSRVRARKISSEPRLILEHNHKVRQRGRRRGRGDCFTPEWWTGVSELVIVS